MLAKPYLNKLEQLIRLWTTRMAPSKVQLRDGLVVSIETAGKVKIQGKARRIWINFKTRDIRSSGIPKRSQKKGKSFIVLVRDWDKDYVPMVGESALAQILLEVLAHLEALLLPEGSDQNWKNLLKGL